jgi:DNA-binding response OmpR family regulator
METIDILVVDDERSILGLFEAFLNRTNYSCQVAESGEEALDKLTKVIPRIILLDINLGDKTINGIDLCVEIRETNNDSIIYAITGLGVLFEKFSPKVAGFDRVFTKPFNYKKLLDTIDEDLKRINF